MNKSADRRLRSMYQAGYVNLQDVVRPVGTAHTATTRCQLFEAALVQAFSSDAAANSIQKTIRNKEV